ncbi:MAG: hypothetical protein J6X55_11435 [Victivallales bacterium]|nr:hypothetical protein [Victivallales bacterium]
MAKSRKITYRQTDGFMKGIFRIRDVVALLLKGLIPEFGDTPVAQIASECLSPHDDSRYIQFSNLDTANDSMFDIVFNARLPGAVSDKECHIVNIEFQNRIHPMLYYIKRGIYYLSKIIVSQKGMLFDNDDYAGLRKVHSIWICPRAPLKYANKVCHVVMGNLPLQGFDNLLPLLQEFFDLLDLKVICLNDDVPPVGNPTLRLLHTLISSNISTPDRERILKDEFSIKPNTEEKTMYDMFHYAQIDGIARGRKEGRVEGRKEGIEIGCQKGIAIGKNDAYQAIAMKMLAMGKSPDEIRALLGMSVKDFMKIASK